MSATYYSLIAGLPDIILDDNRGFVPFAQCAGDLEQWVEAGDRKLIRYVRYQFDNANLMLATGDAKDGRQFDSRGYFSQAELADAVKTGGDGDIPDYMQAFLASRRDGKELFPGLNPEDGLATLFYDEAIDSKNKFISQWFEFDRDLRNVLAGLNARMVALKGGESELRNLLERSIIGRNDIAQAILKSSAPDFGLAAVASWAEAVTGLDFKNTIEREKKLDQLRWDAAENLSWFHGFGINAILGFLVRLAIAQRWQNLEPETGKKMFEILAGEIKKGFKI